MPDVCNNCEYIGVTMNAIASDNKRYAEKKYYEMLEHSMDEMNEKIA